jgi:hypothetical protein
MTEASNAGLTIEDLAALVMNEHDRAGVARVLREIFAQQGRVVDGTGPLRRALNLSLSGPTIL